ncbi:unnamed protein product [Prorocentrum cordatum]|uniref:Uncharacterized protein n=2 Tax=Prorocentrum cordatum TaxID=2364126 RepID=A0ABN9TY91_9DINO|nr:unnamed protein product [Polarella glacialis]
MHASMRMASTSIFKQKPIVPQENRTNRTTSSRKASCSIVKSFCTTAASRTPLSIVMATSTTGTSTSHFMKKSTTGPCQAEKTSPRPCEAVQPTMDRTQAVPRDPQLAAAGARLQGFDRHAPCLHRHPGDRRHGDRRHPRPPTVEAQIYGHRRLSPR